MPKSRPTCKKGKPYNEKQLEVAIAEVQDGSSIQAAAKKNARMGNMPPPMSPPFPYPDRPMPRYGMERGYPPPDRGFAPERGFGGDRNYAGERMRPYPDPYDRRPPPPISPGMRDDYYYPRRAYDEYGFDRYGYSDDRDMVASQGMAAAQFGSGPQEMRREQYDTFTGMSTAQQYPNRSQEQFPSFPRGMATNQNDANRMGQYDASNSMMDSSFPNRSEIRRDVDPFNTMTTQYNTGAYDIKPDQYGNISSMITSQSDTTHDISSYGGITGTTPVSQYGNTLMDLKRDYMDQFSGMATAAVAAARESMATAATYPNMASYGLSTTQQAEAKRDFRDALGMAGFLDRAQETSGYGSITSQYGNMSIDMKRDYSNTFAAAAAAAGTLGTPQQTTQSYTRMGREYEQFERMNTQFNNGSANLWREQYARLTGSLI